MENLLKKTQELSQEATKESQAAQKAAVQVARKLEAQIKEALDEQPLKGVPNLGSKQAPFYGAQLRTKDPYKALEPGKGRLCIDRFGSFQLVEFSRGTNVEQRVDCRPAEDKDFVPQDIETIPRTVEEVLKRHINSAEQSSKKFIDLKHKADRILKDKG